MELRGNPVSQGIAIGEVYRYEAFLPCVTEKLLEAGQAEDALARYRQTRELAEQELAAIRDKLSQSDENRAKIFTAHIDILCDEAMDEEIRDGIVYSSWSPEWAVRKVYDKFIRILQRSKNELMRERADDLVDVSNRLLRIWYGVEEKNLALLERPVVVVARDLLPSDTATLDRDKVLAIVTEMGGATSHSAIIAKSYGIPALLGVCGASTQLRDGDTVVVDAISGVLITGPDEQQREHYRIAGEEFAKKTRRALEYLDKKAVTADGEDVAILLNIGSANAQELEGAAHTDGVGLFRTEFLYMGKPQLPTEDEQLEIYKKVLTVFGDRPVTLRTLDIGGDKKLECLQLPKEENPFLGNRALRLCFDNLPVFRTQLRAAFRASVFGNLRIMFPMVGSIDDLRKAKAVVAEVKGQLDRDGIAYDPSVMIGIMVEIPSIAVIADLAAEEADFASIGTNDLCQYTTATDRMNPTVSKYYQSYHPALFRLIGNVVREFEKRGKPVCICGELGGDPLAIPALIGLGMRHLSMGLSSVGQAKQLIANLTSEQTHGIAEKVCALPTAGEIEAMLKDRLDELV